MVQSWQHRVWPATNALKPMHGLLLFLINMCLLNVSILLCLSLVDLILTLSPLSLSLSVSTADCSDLAVYSYTGSGCDSSKIRDMYYYESSINQCTDIENTGMFYSSVYLMCTLGTSISIPTSSVVTK